MLDRLRNLNLEVGDIDDMMAMYAFGQQVKATYNSFAMDAPEWLDANLALLHKEIASRVRGELEARLRKVVLRREALKTREEKRGDLEQEEQRLRERLGTTAAPTVPTP